MTSMRHRMGLAVNQVKTRADLPPDFAARLKAYRLARGWTQREMAGYLEVNISHVYNLEVGKHKPSDRVAARIGRLIPEIWEAA